MNPKSAFNVGRPVKLENEAWGSPGVSLCSTAPLVGDKKHYLGPESSVKQKNIQVTATQLLSAPVVRHISCR